VLALQAARRLRKRLRFTRVVFVNAIKSAASDQVYSFANPVIVEGGVLCDGKFVPYANVRYADVDPESVKPKKK
jgi:hypothetical protein